MTAAPKNLARASRSDLDSTVAEIEREAPAGVLDCRASLERLDGDAELFRDLLGFYFRDVPDLLAHIDRALSAGDADGVRRWAHRLKGLISNFDARIACHSAFELEQMGHQGALEQGRPTYARLVKELAELTTWLQRF